MTIQRQIRDAIQARIQAALPGVHYFRAPRRNLALEELPSCCVYSQGDRPASEDCDHQATHERIYTMRVELRAAALPEEDATDDLAVAVRRALLGGDALTPLDGVVHRVDWETQQWDGDEGEPPLGGTYLDFNFFYMWRPEW